MNQYKLLPALNSLLKTCNLTLSANDLSVTQSAMSKTLQQIRLAFNDPILIREGNRYILSAKAEQLKVELPSLLRQLDGVFSPPDFDISSCERTFEFASSDYVAHFVLPKLYTDFSAVASKASLNFVSWKSDQLHDMAKNQVDFVSTIVDSVPENLYGRKLAEDTFVVVMRKGHPLQNEPLSLQQYIGAEHIIISAGGDKNSWVDNVLLQKDMKRKAMIRVPFFQAAIELLKVTDGVLTLPLHIAANFTQYFDIQIKALPVSVPKHTYYQLWHAKNHHDPYHKWFREFCFGFFESHIATTMALGHSLLKENK